MVDIVGAGTCQLCPVLKYFDFVSPFQARDQGTYPLATTTTVSAIISDVNYHPSQFDWMEIFVYVSESATIGQKVHLNFSQTN